MSFRVFRSDGHVRGKNVVEGGDGEFHAAGNLVGVGFESVEGGHARDGDHETEDGGQEGFPNASSQIGRFDRALKRLDLGEGDDHANHGAEQTYERREMRDRGQYSKSFFDLLEGEGGDTFEIIEADLGRAGEIFQIGLDNPGDGVAAGPGAGENFGDLAGLEPFEHTLKPKVGLKTVAKINDHAFNDHGDGENRPSEQDPHERAARAEVGDEGKIGFHHPVVDARSLDFKCK